jgi:hypothetical protein
MDKIYSRLHLYGCNALDQNNYNYTSNFTYGIKVSLLPPFLLRSASHYGPMAVAEQRKDSSNAIGREQKFVRLAFTLESNGQKITLFKIPTWQHFL